LKLCPKKALIFAGCSLVALALIFIIFNDFAMAYIDRFIKGNVGGSTNATPDSGRDVMSVITTSRSELWLIYIEYLFMHPLALFFGKGINAKPVLIESPHNVYISIIFELGIVGTLIFAMMIYMLMKKMFLTRNKPVTKAVFLPIVVLGLLMCVEDLIFFLYFY